MSNIRHMNEDEFHPTLPDEIPNLIDDPYVITIKIRDDDAMHALDASSFLADVWQKDDDGKLVARFARTLSRMRYEDFSGVNDAIDEAYAAIGRAVVWQMEQDIRAETNNPE